MSEGGPREHRLIAGAVAPTLLRFSLPLLTTNLLHALTGTWAAIWVSHTLDENALTGVINTQVFVWLVMGVVSWPPAWASGSHVAPVIRPRSNAWWAVRSAS
jgi:Na+-driven multidrug efflux pump